ncbi:BTAD domain-containing putative transcriptional regulator [Streptomyces sp. NPDC127066]|uniref:AfsR/SARP family transcriptional regulator n=1 Tax=Streptomyces sp. NPDC127066 TaxID=3347125 RepID=UPI0036560811
MSLRFGLLGPVLLYDGAGTTRVSSPKGRVLLAALLLQANRPVALEHLRHALWGERPPVGAKAALPNHVTRLRRLLALADGGASRVRAVPPGYLLEVHDGELDLDVFEERRALARRARTDADWEEVARTTGAALDLWRGNPLADLPEFAESHAQLPVVRRLVEARLEVLEWRFDAALGRGNHHGLVAELASVADEHPLREVFHRQLMLALHRTDRQAEALEVFQRLRLTLADELGVAPGPAVQEAYQEILTRPPGRPSDSAGPAGPARSAPEGDSRTPPGVLAVPPPAPRSEPVPEQPAFSSQLPMDVRHFVGRAAELDLLVSLLSPDPSSGELTPAAPVVVTGMGGIGKTALAVHAAHRLRHRFPDGILYADLRGFGAGAPRSAGDLLARFLSDLGAVHGPLPEESDDRAAMFRAALAERRVLLVLDNARDSCQVAPLLPGSGPSAAIVTSRQTLAPLPGADLLPLKPLGPAEQRDLLAELCGASRLRHEPAAAADILAACGGLPLALRIAGARLAARPSWPLTALAERLGGPSGRLRALSVGGTAVRTTFGMSYVALRDSERPTERAAARAFRLMGLWPCHVVSLECAAALLGLTVDDAEDAVEVLVDAHLLESPQPGRYTFHDLLGDYAQERVAAEETLLDRHNARSRLLVWYAAAAAESCRTVSWTSQAPPPLDEQAAAPMPVFADAESALHWSIQELPAITEAIALAGELRRSDVAWRLAVEMFGYAETYWWTGEWDALLDTAMAIALRAGDTLGQAWLQRRIGVAHGMAYRNEAAVESLLAALTLYEAIGDVTAQASITGNISMCYAQMDRPREALQYARRSQELSGRAGNEVSTVVALTRMTEALVLGGQLEEAESKFRKLLALLESEHRHPTQVATALTNFGRTLTALGRREEALETLCEALAIRRGLDDEGGTVDCLEAVAEAYFAFGDRQQARVHWEQSLLISRTLGLAHGIEQAQQGLAMLTEHA